MISNSTERSAGGTITTQATLGLTVGDRVRLLTDTNRMRRRIASITGTTQFKTTLHVRPSKGFARHVRRGKAGQ